MRVRERTPRSMSTIAKDGPRFLAENAALIVGTPRWLNTRRPVMLVLSRGRNDKVVFPTLGISVEILRVAGNKVRLGIEAPQEVPVHRHELTERVEAGGDENSTLKFPAPQLSAARKLNHAMRNRLNAAALGLHLLHKKLEMGDLSDSETTIFKIFNELKALENQIESPA